MDGRGDNNGSDENWGSIKADVTEIGDKNGVHQCWNYSGP